MKAFFVNLVYLHYFCSSINRKKRNMKILHYRVFLFLIINWGCIVADPDIPEGYNSYEKGGEPEAHINVWELSQYSAVLKINIASVGNRKLTQLRACYSETNPLPDTTDWVRDSSWEKVARIPWIEEQYACGFNFADRYFALSSLYPVEGGNKLIEYLPETDEWVKRSVLPFGCRVGPVAVVAGGKGYAGLGDIEVITEDGSHRYYSQQDWWCYDPEMNEWERKADIPASTTGMMAAFGIEEKVYVVTSTDYWNSTPMQVWEYDTRSDAWSRKRNFPGDKLQRASSFVIGGRPFVFTGITNRMEEGGNVDGKGYAGFGVQPVTETYLIRAVDWWCYDPDTDRWGRRSVLTDWFNIRPSISFALRGHVYIGSIYDGVWKYVE